MIQTRYIEVAVTLPVNHTFIYEIPENLDDRCVPGMRVLVPFGRRRVTGYILKRQETSDGYAVKKIVDILDDMPLFPESQIAFFKWISEYYIHPIGEVIKSALPSGLNRHDVACVFPTPKGKRELENETLTHEETNIMQFLESKKSYALKNLTKQVDIPSGLSLVRKMEKRDLLSVSTILKKDQARVQKEKFIIGQKKPVQKIRLSNKRKEILAITSKFSEISLTGLKQKVPTAARLIKPLAEAGYIRIVERSVFRDPLGDPVEPDVPPQLTQEQQQVVERVSQNTQNGFCAYLLSGVTGSGKTEVYMRVVQDVVEKGKSAIVLVPEISLISQTERRFRARFGENVAVIHSSLSKGEVLDQWRKIALNKVAIVVGARSAIFAPFKRPGVIIVDEEHDGSYKQESGLKYNARDLAAVRAKMNQMPVIFGSATPSVQSYYNVVATKFEELKLEERINKHPLPQITPVDLKKYNDVRGIDRIITPELAIQIKQCLKAGNQALIFLNRRGFATSPLCQDCGESLKCRYCDVTMTYHKGANEYRCHFCGFAYPEKVRCPKCKSRKIKPLGYGTQKIESILKKMFPEARLARMDQDSTSKKGSMIKILRSIRNRTVDIIVGTQMLAKGHDFPFITLVGIVCADLSLSLPDFRAGERTFQLLAQVAGRAGRGQTPGKVIMQTYAPDHFIIEASKRQDFINFFNNEAPFRKALQYPPYSKMIQIKISGNDFSRVKNHAMALSHGLDNLIAGEKEVKEKVQVLGPIEAPIQKISSRYRWQILLKSSSANLLNRLVRSVLIHPSIKSHKNISVAVDVDPYSLM